MDKQASKSCQDKRSKTKFYKKRIKGRRKVRKCENSSTSESSLKKIKEFDGFTKFCQCCYNPMKDQVHVKDFNFCDSTDEFAGFGIGISLYFIYLKYAIFVFYLILLTITIPNTVISSRYTKEIINMCQLIYSKEGNNINFTFPLCNGFVQMENDSYEPNSQLLRLYKFNSMNIKQYREIFFNITNGNENINKVLFNYHLFYFICLISLLILHTLYTLLLFNIIKQYNILVSSPSDFAVIITNLQSSFEIFFSEINNLNKLIRDKIIEKDDLIRKNFIGPEDAPNTSRQIFKRYEDIWLDKLEKNNEIKILEGFKELINNIICENKNGEQYDIYLINTCYKINEFKIIKDKIKEKNNVIYIAKNDHEQLRKNRNKDLSPKESKYFYHPLDIFGLYVCPFTLFEKSKKISEIEEEKQKLEEKLKSIIKDVENLSKENFSGVVFIIFNSMQDKDRFLECRKKNLIMTIINMIINLKYYLYCCCINSSKRREYFLKHNIVIDEALEPEDIIYENLEFNWIQRLFRIIFVYIISSMLIAICFFFILYLNSIQARQSQSNKGNNIKAKYSVSISISLNITIINVIFQKILVILTKIEKQICMTNYFLSYSIKLTILTFISSVIIPYLSSNYHKEQLNHDILITNCFTMFLSNSFLTPITWTINFDYFLKKLRICIINKKKKRLPQDELNSLYELLDMDISAKYSYVTRTLLMGFFYMSIFPFGIPICCIGFIFAYILEKCNFMKRYKKPKMLNGRIYEVYSNFFVINLFMVSLGDYLFLKDTLESNVWVVVNTILFSILIIIPYNNLLSIDFIGINESDLKKGKLYEDYFNDFINDYERNNPITKKDGIKHFLDKLLEKVLITKDDYDSILENYENMNLLEIYYKSKLHFGSNLLKRALNDIKFKKQNENKNLDLNNINNIDFEEIDEKEKINLKDSEDTKEKHIKPNKFRRNQKKILRNNDFIMDSTSQKKRNKINKKSNS